MKFLEKSSFRMPFPGETVILQCRKCKKIFTGPNPKDGGFFDFGKTEKPECPECGSRKVERYFGVMY